MSNVHEILKAKGGTVFSVKPHDSIKDTLKLMAEKNVGAVLVMDNNRIAGVFSERDFARHSLESYLQPEEVPVRKMMTTQVFVVNPSQSMDECMSLMTTKRIRHLPVVEENELVGLISIGDVVKRIIEDHKFAISQLESYVTGIV